MTRHSLAATLAVLVTAVTLLCLRRPPLYAGNPMVRPVVIDLPLELASGAEPPDYACLVYNRALSEPIGTPICELSVRTPSTSYRIVRASYGSDDAFQLRTLDHPSAGQDGDAGVDACRGPSGRDLPDAGAQSDLERALRAVVVESKEWLGEPRFALPPGPPEASRSLGIHCVRRVGATSDATSDAGPDDPRPLPRVLLVGVRFELTAPVFKHMTLESWRISLRYQALSETSHAFAATVLGGHYLAQPGRTGSGQVSLPLVPLRRTVRLEVPEIQFVEGSPVVADGGAPAALAFRNAASDPPKAELRVLVDDKRIITKGISLRSGAHFLEVPTIASNASSPAAKLELHTEPDGGPGDSLLGQDIRLQDVPAVVRMTLRSIAFVWERACLYRPILKKEDCPEVQSLLSGSPCPQAGVTLSDGDGRGGACTYVCTQPSREAFELPLRVRFNSADTADQGTGPVSWEDAVSSVNQRLRSYVPPAARFIALDFTPWAESAAAGRDLQKDAARIMKDLRELPGRRITEVDIVRPDGSTARVIPESIIQRVAVPGIECSDKVPYRIVGSRDHKMGVAQYDRGRFVVQPLDVTVRRYDASLSFGGGVAQGVALTGWDNASALLRRTRPLGVLRAAGAYHWDSRISMEIGGSLALVARDYAPLATDGAATPELVTVPYDRLLVTFSLVLPVGLVSQSFSDSAWVFGVGAGGGFPLLERDTSRAGPTLPIWATSAGLRLPMTDRTWVEPTFQASGGDKVYRYIADPKLNAEVQPESFRPVWLSIDIALRYGF